MNMLIVYYSKYGQTEAIAERIANVLTASQHGVRIIDAEEAQSLASIEAYDIVILGSPIYTERHSDLLKRFIKQHLAELDRKQAAFFSVSLSAAGDANQRREATSCMQSFLDSCNWQPGTTTTFAGALPYRKYNWFVRWLMKRIVRKAGGDTDTSRDYEYPDWNEVENFARSFARENASDADSENQFQIK
jgi:menaquinone-dependent protoporphyrinogen oxidase